MFCKACGARQPDTAQFCSSCGLGLGGGGKSGAVAAPDTGRKTSRQAALPRYLFAAMGATLLLGGTGYGAWFFTQRSGPDPEFVSVFPLVVAKDGKCGAIDPKGQFVIPARYDGMSEFNGNALTTFSRGNLWGIVDTAGKEVVEPRFDWILEIRDNALTPVMTGGSWGYIDKTGQFVIQPQFAQANAFDEEQGAWVQQAELWGRIDKTGRFVIPPKFTEISPFAFGAAPVKVGGRWGLIDPSGQFLVPPRFATLGSPSAQGLMAASNGTKMGLVDRKGEIVAPAIYDSVLSVASGPNPAMRNDKWGFVDQTGKLIIPHMFSWVNPFDEQGMAAVQTVDQKGGFIDKTGKFVIAPRFDYVDDFVADRAIVRVGKLFGLIDRSGAQVVPAGYLAMQRRVSRFTEGRSIYGDAIFVQAPNGLWGVMSLQGKMLIAPRFQSIGCFLEDETGD